MNVQPNFLGRRSLLALGAGVAASGALAACGGSDSGDDSSITYWSNWKEGESQQKILAQAIADFTEETGIAVDVQWQGRQVVQKIVPVLNTPNVPDLVDGGFGKLAPVLTATQQTSDATAAYAMEVEGTKVSDLVPEKVRGDDTMVDGKPWMIPYMLVSEGVWFDKSTHPDIATSPPQTWEEFLALLGDLKGGAVAPVALDGDVSGYNSLWFTSLSVQLGGVGSFRALAEDASGELWDGSAAQQAADLVQQLVEGDYFIEGYAASKWPAQQEKWASGKAALLFNGTWIPTETSSYATEGFEYDSFSLPVPEGGSEGLARADMSGFAIPAKAKSKDAAMKFAVYLLREKYQTMLAEDSHQIPIREDIEVDPSVAQATEKIRNADQVFQQHDGVTSPGYVEKLYWPLGDQLVKGELSGDEFRAEMKKAQITYWKDQG